ncbi:hypothetical protein TraAM80_08603 [Trypanosoma rangeli]|uniref:Uncharacterized protein n=1 Tax=Trypanosoma rangeli TaxID=5698 RepID=A0A422MZU4_TRYRA|nr:uncharacterized protein TraAM80_08603 [Trypanosoma rangeli]RNE98756.1 hypothetical protein TraAM80_08603 [Trypanosoma rangeli]|eukprot:RNE98756.1 hypothetical protein TraAM80_08603 [Trypanosoma rangeli]
MGFDTVNGVAALQLLRPSPYLITGCERRHLTEAEAERHIMTKAVYLPQPLPTMRFAVVLLFIFFLLLQTALVASLHPPWGYRNGFATATIVALGVYPIVTVSLRSTDRI